MLFVPDLMYAYDEYSSDYCACENLLRPASLDTPVASLLPPGWQYVPSREPAWDYQMDLWSPQMRDYRPLKIAGVETIHVINNHVSNQRQSFNSKLTGVYSDILYIGFHAKTWGELLHIVAEHFHEYCRSVCDYC